MQSPLNKLPIPPPPKQNMSNLPPPPPPPMSANKSFTTTPVMSNTPHQPPPPPPLGGVQNNIKKPVQQQQSNTESKIQHYKTNKNQKAFNLRSDPSNTHKDFFSKLYSPHAIQWNKCRACFLSSNPTAGVFFVETQIPDEYVVIKGTSTICQELFGSFIARKLELNAPIMDVIEYAPKVSNREWHEIKYALAKKIESQDTILSARAKKELNRAFFILMEFVPHSISADDLFDLNDLKPVILKNEQVLIDLGKMVVCDVILNNWDRIAVTDMWEHDGNPGNVLFSNIDATAGGPKLVLIDQSISRIHPNNISKYLQRVTQLANDVTTKSATESQVVQSICKFFADCTGYLDFSDADKQLLLNGLLQGIDLVRQWNKDILDNWKQEINGMMTGVDWADVWAEGMKSVDIDFVSQVINALTAN
jgi:hypothetical protein